MLVVSKLRWPRRTIVPNLHLHRQRMLSSTHLSESSISECVRLCDAHGLYLAMVCNNILRDIPERGPPRTYVRTYILCENRSLIQSLALMYSAIINENLQHAPMAYEESDYTIVIAVVHRLKHMIIVQKFTSVVEFRAFCLPIDCHGSAGSQLQHHVRGVAPTGNNSDVVKRYSVCE